MTYYQRRTLGLVVRSARTFLQTGAAMLVAGATIMAQPWSVILATAAMAALASLVTNSVDLLRDIEEDLGVDTAPETEVDSDSEVLVVEPPTEEEAAEVAALSEV